MEQEKSKHDLLTEWFPVKEQKHNTSIDKIQKFADGEIWWTAVGENVGVEINGKSEYFSRPVLIFKKLSRQGFMGIPLSTKNHKSSWYVSFRFQGKDISAVISQAKVFSSSRLYSRLGQIAEDDMEKIQERFKSIYLPE